MHLASHDWISLALWILGCYAAGAVGGIASIRGRAFYVLQLALNALWTWLFFAFRKGALAFAEVLLLFLVVVVTALLFTRIEPIAGILMVPYLIWLGVAMALNHAVWRDNPTLL